MCFSLHFLCLHSCDYALKKTLKLPLLHHYFNKPSNKSGKLWETFYVDSLKIPKFYEVCNNVMIVLIQWLPMLGENSLHTFDIAIYV
jgi:hypothetical protein